MTTFALEPRRGRVLAAKAAVTTVLAVLASVLTVAFAVTALTVSAALGRDVDRGLEPGRVVGLPLALLLGLLGAFALATVLHLTAAAIVAVFAVPLLINALGALLRDATEYVDVVRTSTYVLEGDYAGNIGPILTSQALWLVLPLVLGVLRTQRREVG